MKSIPLWSVLVLLAACGKDAPAPAPSDAQAKSAYALASEPAGSISVVKAKEAAPKDAVVVVGRVREITKGFAAFTLTDDSVEYCGMTEKEGCPEPWDYCCKQEEAAAKTISVAVPAPGGSAVALPKIPELRNLDLVVVTGRLVKDKAGNVELEATGWYRKERPELPAGIVFPQ